MTETVTSGFEDQYQATDVLSLIRGDRRVVKDSIFKFNTAKSLPPQPSLPAGVTHDETKNLNICGGNFLWT